MKGRSSFIVVGVDPILTLLQDRLIRRGFVLERDVSNADFALVGGLALWDAVPPSVPTLLISSGLVYSDRTDKNKVRDKTSMSESEPLVVPSLADGQLLQARLSYMAAEAFYVQSGVQTLVLRLFDVYGPRILHGTVHTLVDAAKRGCSLEIPYPGFQRVTFLHEADLLLAFDKFVGKFLKGKFGVYNVGSPEEVSYKQLAKTVQDFASTKVDIVEVPAPSFHRWWVTPDLTRTSAAIRWKPHRSLRAGIFDLFQKSTAPHLKRPR